MAEADRHPQGQPESSAENHDEARRINPAAAASLAAGDLEAMVNAMQSGIAELGQGLGGGLSYELVELQRRASLGAVAGLLAHEVNNILTPVLAYVQLARRQGADAAAIERGLREAEEGVARTSRVAKSILDLARGAGIDECPATECMAVIREAVSALGRDPGRDGITIEIRCEPELCVPMPADALRQVLLNLIQNARNALLAAKHDRNNTDARSGAHTGEPARIVVRARTEPCSTWNTRVVIEIQDNGPGIPRERRGEIFRPFVRGDRSAIGTGLGLTVCRELTAASGGRLDLLDPATDEAQACGADKGGACFRIVLPATCADRQAA